MSFKNKKIAIVWANPYNKNLGVGALAYSSLALIHDVLKENNIQGEITFVGSYKSGVDFVGIGTSTIKYDNIYGLDYLNVKSWIKILLKPFKYRVGKLMSFDYIFDIAEGDSFADIYGDRRFFRIYNSKRLFDFFGKRQILLPQTIGPFANPQRDKQAKAIMKKMELVLSRDKKSYDFTKSFLPENKIKELIDVAFYMPYQRQIISNGKINVGINVSGLLWNGGYTGKNQFNMKTDYKKLITDILDYFTNQKDVRVHIVSHVIPENSPVENDANAAAKIKELYPDVVLSPKFQSPIEAKGYISGLDFFTGGRMHACIAAFSSGVPVVPMAYSRKFNGLFTDTLKYPWIADCVNEELDRTFKHIIDGYNNRNLLAEAINRSQVEIITPRLRELKAILCKVLSK
ncbi:MAG: polysaccharide pyruvyl transferase family protein [Pseudosphingobacterium sp.]|nr:polysaccharide pyruvyl transferase family protein [Olivibacter sp. UJ_SKK_5.1]MDX3912680.1 polysaccharide pyruvyl transferase family protein [Pseudosphingobacterium sp.]